MNRAPAFQFYAKDWLSSGKIAVMTLEEEGAYIHLLAHCWDSDDCTLPDDDTELAHLSRLGDRWLNGGATKLRACFIAHPKKSGRLFNARLMKERKKQDAWRKKSREGGKQSSISRALLSKAHSTVVEGCFNGASTVVEPKGNSSSSLSSSLKNKTLVLNGQQSGFDIFWKSYPRKRNKGRAEKAWIKLQPDELLLGTMLSKIDQAKETLQWKKDNGEFIPHPASWLNGKGWEDEFTPPNKERLPL